MLSVATVPAARRQALQPLGYVLLAEDGFERAEVAIVPTWAGPAGALEAADLFLSGKIGRVAILAGPSDRAQQELRRRGVQVLDSADQLTKVLTALGVTAIERLPRVASGTEAEGEILSEWCGLHQIGSIVVITSPDHSRRLRRVLRRSMTDASTRVSIRFTRQSSFRPESWWQDRGSSRIVIIELQKLLLDVLRHPFS